MTESQIPIFLFSRGLIFFYWVKKLNHTQKARFINYKYNYITKWQLLSEQQIFLKFEYMILNSLYLSEYIVLPENHAHIS